MLFHNHAIIRKELWEMMRTSRLLIWVVVSTFFGILSPLTAYYMPDLLNYFGATENIMITFGTITYHDAMEQYIKNFSQIGTIILILMLMGSVAGEKADGSVQFLLVRPVGHIKIVAAKLFSLVVLLLVGLAAAMVSMGFYSWYLFPGFPVMPFLLSNWFLFFYFFTIGSLTIAISASVRKPIIAGIGGLALWVLATIAGAIHGVGNFSFVKLIDQVVQTTEGFPVEWEPTVGAILVLAIVLWFGIGIFKRWEPND